MAYDERLADRVRELIAPGEPVEEKRMFGGLSFLVGGHLAVAASSRGGLLVRVGADDHAGLLTRDHVEPMVMGGRRSRTWVHVAADGVRTEPQLAGWVARGEAVARALAAEP